jgi:hypothetical protein
VAHMSEFDRTCFVIGPIGGAFSKERRDADWLLEDIIKPVASSEPFNLDVIRSDRISVPGDINVQVINYVIDSRIVIADLSGGNPNVFYELALRHMSNAPVIHMIPKGTVPPFDISTFRCIKFSFDTVDERDVARKMLKESLQETQKETYKIQNPVTIARGFKESESKREVSPDSLQDTFVNLQDRIQKIERTLDLAGDAARDFVDMLNKGPASKEMLSKFLNSFRHEKTLDDLLS